MIVKPRDCKNCGKEFQPAAAHYWFCSAECQQSAANKKDFDLARQMQAMEFPLVKARLHEQYGEGMAAGFRQGLEQGRLEVRTEMAIEKAKKID